MIEKLIQALEKLVAMLRSKYPPPPISNPINTDPPPPAPLPPTHVSLIPSLAQGIFFAEGNGTQGGMKYNNRGDLRGLPDDKYLLNLGATGFGENNLAIFPSMAIGDQACVQLCTDAALGLLPAYKGDTIQSFVKIYASPPTQAAWDNYVAILCKYTGKVATDLISSLL